MDGQEHPDAIGQRVVAGGSRPASSDRRRCLGLWCSPPGGGLPRQEHRLPSRCSAIADGGHTSVRTSPLLRACSMHGGDPGGDAGIGGGVGGQQVFGTLHGHAQLVGEAVGGLPVDDAEVQGLAQGCAAGRSRRLRRCPARWAAVRTCRSMSCWKACRRAASWEKWASTRSSICE